MEGEIVKKDHFLATSIVIAAIIIGGAFIYGTGAKNSGNVADAPTMSNATIDDDVILGNPDAPVTIIEFGDYQCPFCKQSFNDTEQQLRDEYIATGKVRKVYRDFPIDNSHPFARDAAEAAECAGDQESYWAYHDALFTRQSEIPTMDFVALAGELGLDTVTFEACYTSGTYADEVEKDYQDGIAAGVRGTPTSFINGKYLPGLVSYEILKATIETALQEAEGK